MSNIKKAFQENWDKLLSLIGTLAVLLPTSPLNLTTPFRDSGVFLYTGWMILNGAIPYKDIWDHKPPVIFYINALGLKLLPYSRWGGWGIEALSLWIAALIGYKMLKKIFGGLPALLSLLLWLLALVSVIQGGNFTTEYTLPLQFAALSLVLTYGWEMRSIHFLILGTTGAIAFLTKQTTIGIWISIVVVILSDKFMKKEFKEIIHNTVAGVIGITIASLIILAQIILSGAFENFWNAAFEFNFHYTLIIAQKNNIHWFPEVLWSGIKPLTKSGLFQIAIIGYLFCLIQLIRKTLLEQIKPLMLVAIFNLPIELWVLGSTDKTYPHYFMTILPVLAIFSGYAFYNLFKLKIPRVQQTYIHPVLTTIIICILIQRTFYIYMDQVYVYRKYAPYEETLSYIQENTNPSDYVLQIGNEAGINFASKRISPTRFIYQKPLRWDGYVTTDLIEQFLTDIIQHQPKYIIHTTPDSPMFKFPVSNAKIDNDIQTIETHYCKVEKLDSFIIYKYSENNCNSE